MSFFEERESSQKGFPKTNHSARQHQKTRALDRVTFSSQQRTSVPFQLHVGQFFLSIAVLAHFETFLIIADDNIKNRVNDFPLC